MALILAIESDRRQVNHLTAMVRGKLRAELVLGDTAETALERLGDRVPDLILTSPLLSPRDEQALSDRLRKLNGVASHVHTLTLPLFAPPTGASAPSRGGMLSVLLGDRGSESAPDGCDPAVFAEQCRVYLKRSAAEREASEENAEIIPATDTAILDEPPQTPEPLAATPEVLKAFDTPTVPEVPKAASGIHLTADPTSILAAFAAVEEPQVIHEPVTQSRAEADVEAEPESNFVDVDLSEMLEASAEPVDAEVIEEQPAVYDLSAAAEPSAPAAEDDFEDWEKVVESLKRAGSRVQLPRQKEPEPKAPAVRAKTGQDEFGMYDPKLAGMAALFAKLEEFSDDDDPSQR